MVSCSRNSYVLTGPGAGKLVTIVFGIMVLIIGLRSHFESAWTEYDYHKICNFEDKIYKAPCPDISMERFYVAIVIICFIISVMGLILTTYVFNPYNILVWIFDLVYHGLASVLLFIGAILYIVSAIKISQHPIVMNDSDNSAFLPPHIMKIKDTEVFMSTQKIIAGVLTILEAFVYIITVHQIRRARSRNSLAERPLEDDFCNSEEQ